jgi:tetratricopeptide (TPR) repeat protein
MYLHNLGTQLGNRYSRTGAITDLEEAIRVIQEAVKATPEDHPDWAGYLHNLGIQLRNRYLRTGAITDLEEAIRVAQEAVKATPEDHPDRAGYLNNLGTQLGDRYSRTGAITDLEEAIQVTQEAIKARPEDHPGQAGYLNNLGIRLGDRYLRTGAITDLEEAIRVTQEAVKAKPEDHPDRAGYLNNLGIQLGDRYSRTGAIIDLKEAISYHQSALRQPAFPTVRRIVAGREILQYCAIILDWQQAYEASEIAIPLIPKLTSRSLENADKQYRLGQVVGLASDAAAVALHAEKGPLVALGFLEQGRGVLAASLEDIRTDILYLQERYPEMAKQYARFRDELELPVTHKSSWRAQGSWRYEAGKELDKLIVEIRKQSGFEDFLLAPSEAEMQAAAKYGPIIVINVSKYRCDAILIEQHQIRFLALPNLNSEEIKKKAQRDDLGVPKFLEWLWDVVTNPILDALGFTQPPSDNNWPHVWWIPTGPLSKFPLHAAGRHTKGSFETVPDRVMSSYSLSVKAIIYSRRRPITLSTSAQALLVAMEDTPGSSRLPSATKEIAMLHGLCKSMAFNPIEPGRRKRDVASHLRQCKIFHFAGHGCTDDDDPSKSHLLLEDWKNDPLMVATLLEMNIRECSPFLAYLSACGTGQIKDQKFVDESIHLISAFQLAGFRHVIGTLWEVNDQLCLDMARITYEVMRDGGMTDESVCRGLHNATRELRDRWLNMPAKARRGSKSVRTVDVPFVGDEVEAQSTSVGDQRDDSLPRDVVLCDDSDDEGWTGSLHWVPYIHFGV